MEKMRMESINMIEQNIGKIEALFPDVITEAKDENGKLKKVINFELLKQVLSDDVVDGDEAYELTWVGKKASIVEAGNSIRKTLRPCKEESKNWDNTENLYIEGDNLDVLKLLQESYLGQIKVIYIDPPYNTGNDIIYKNDYSISEDEYEEGYSIDENGYIMFQNIESNGRFHSDWLSMMYPRIKLAKNLLTDDGFFLISIDHNELFNLGEVCDEIFGYSNRIGIIAVVHKPEGRNQAKFIGPSHEYMLIYAKNEKNAKLQKVALDDDQVKSFSLSDDKGPYKLKNFIRLSDGKYSLRENKPSFWYPIYVSDDLRIMDIKEFERSTTVYPITDTGIERTWKTTKETFYERYKEGNIEAQSEDGTIKIFEKLREDQVIKTHWIDKKYHGFHFGTKILDNILGVKSFDFPKSLYLMKDIYKLFAGKNDIILDFFSGSATSAHAIMELNGDDGGNRRFIMVQIPAECDRNSDAYKSGYNNICEIGKERIRRAGEKVKEEKGLTGKNLDIGFRVFKLDNTNMKDVYYGADQYYQNMLHMLESNIKENRTDMDLLFGCLLEWGVQLSLPHTSEELGGVTVHTINDGDLIACFEQNISEAVIREIAKRQPLRAVFRDSSFASSPEKINVEEIFKLMAPHTSVKVL
jgi:adenine-specific DNA-methyltransferase